MGKLQTHLQDDFEEYVRSEAQRRDVSVSEHIRKILKHYHHQENLDEELEKTNAERKIEELIALAKDEITKTSEWQKEIVVRGTVNQIALFELAKGEYAWNDQQIRDAFSVGSYRVRQALAELGVSLDEMENIVEDPESLEADDDDEYPWQNPDPGGDGS